MIVTTHDRSDTTPDISDAAPDEPPRWMAHGICAGHTELFFAPHAERPPSRLRREAAARAMARFGQQGVTGFTDALQRLTDPGLNSRLNKLTSSLTFGAIQSGQEPIEDQFHRIGQALADMPEVLEAYLLTGEYDYLIKVAVAASTPITPKAA